MTNYYEYKDYDGDNITVYGQQGEDDEMTGLLIELAADSGQVFVKEEDLVNFFHGLVGAAIIDKPVHDTLSAVYTILKDAVEKQEAEIAKVATVAQEIFGKSFDQLNEAEKHAAFALPRRIRGYEIQTKTTGEADWDEVIHDSREDAIGSLTKNYHNQYSDNPESPQYWGHEFRIVTLYQ